jgi:hypothetical protein
LYGDGTYLVACGRFHDPLPQWTHRLVVVIWKRKFKRTSDGTVIGVGPYDIAHVLPTKPGTVLAPTATDAKRTNNSESVQFTERSEIYSMCALPGNRIVTAGVDPALAIWSIDPPALLYVRQHLLPLSPSSSSSSLLPSTPQQPIVSQVACIPIGLGLGMDEFRIVSYCAAIETGGVMLWDSKLQPVQLSSPSTSSSSSKDTTTLGTAFTMRIQPLALML